ncbi:MAG: hypothetical protein K1X81_08930 [Bacteroidia bacterium]|nr:hypothetical protein [Bacteroidia bacterium]
MVLKSTTGKTFLLFYVTSLLFFALIASGCNNVPDYPDYSGMYRCIQNEVLLDTTIVEDTCLVSLYRTPDQEVYTVGVYSQRWGTPQTTLFNAKMNYHDKIFTCNNSVPIESDTWYGYLIGEDSLVMTHKIGHLGISTFNYLGTKVK